MNARILTFLLATVATVPSFAQVPPTDVSGWGPTAWGMTRDEVQAVLPAARRPHSGETGDLVLENVELGGTLAQARLFIGPRGLERVFVTAPRVAVDPNLRDRVISGLTAALGGGRSSAEAPDDTDVRWLFPSTEVRLLYSRLSHPDVRWEGLFVVYARGGRRPENALSSK